MNSDARPPFDRDPVELARELFLYAPIGLAGRLGKEFPDLVAEGKAKYDVARVVGSFAAKQGVGQFEQRLRDAANSFLRGGDAGDDDRVDDTPAGGAAKEGATGTGPQPDLRMGASGKPEQQQAEAHDLAISDYATLSAAQILTHLPSLTVEQRNAVAAYESNTRKRRTILNRIEQLNADS